MAGVFENLEAALGRNACDKRVASVEEAVDVKCTAKDDRGPERYGGGDRVRQDRRSTEPGAARERAEDGTDQWQGDERGDIGTDREPADG